MDDHLRALFKRLLHVPYVVQSALAQRQILDLVSVEQGVRLVIDIDRAVDHVALPGKASIKVYRVVGLPGTEPVLKWAISTYAPPFGVLTADLEARLGGLLAQLEAEDHSSSAIGVPVMTAPGADSDPLARLHLDALLHTLIETVKVQTQAVAAKLSHAYLTVVSPADQVRLNTMRVDQVEREAVEWAKAGAPGWDGFAREQQTFQAVFSPPADAVSVLPEPVALYLHYVRCEALYHGYLWLIQHVDTVTPGMASDDFTRDLFLRDQSS